MQRLILPLVASLLVLLAVGGVYFGLNLQPADTHAAEVVATPGTATPDTAAPDTAAPTTQQLADPVTNQPEAADPLSFIRFGVPIPPAKPQDTIRLATYNVENLFDDIDDPDLFGRSEDIDDTKPEAHLQALADAIHLLDADILALQEIESNLVITDFRDTYLADLGYEHLASIDAGDERGIEQAVLSRYPITETTNWRQLDLGGTHPDKWGRSDNWHAGEPIRFHRSPLRVTVQVPAQTPGSPAYDLTLYVVHAKSGGPGEYWRLAEARGLVNILMQDAKDHPDQNTVILGDFNANLTAESLSAFTDAGFADAFASTVTPGNQPATHSSGRRIDYILINQNLASEVLPHAGFILGTPTLPEGVDYRDPWRPEGYASDHLPVAVEITPVEP
jgi:endonuclease/exonuclease/phosphatase family metal-dependent hydrolase